MNEKIVKGLICPDCGSSVKTTDGSWFECTNCRKIESTDFKFKIKNVKEEEEEQVAFAMVRQQPLTNGHFNMYSEMVRDNDVVIIGLGSVGAPEDILNPFNEVKRTEFIRKVFGKNSKDKIKIVPIRDIGAVREGDWQGHCMKMIDGKNLPTPTRYYAGSDTDLHWFKGAKNINGKYIELINVNRHETNFLSGTMVRQSLAMGTKEWETQVPRCLVGLIRESFPERLTLKYNQEKKLR